MAAQLGKPCSKCKIKKSISEFSKDNSTKDKISSCCKKCESLRGKEYRKKHKNILSIKRRKYYLKNKEKAQVTRKKYYKTHRNQMLEKNKQYREKNRDKIALREKKYYEQNKEKITLYYREYKCKKKYGITLEEKNQMLLEQDGKCLGCNKNLINPKDCHLDHDHNTKKIRGILCGNCNKVLGLASDNPKTLTTLARYVVDNS